MKNRQNYLKCVVGGAGQGADGRLGLRGPTAGGEHAHVQVDAVARAVDALAVLPVLLHQRARHLHVLEHALELARKLSAALGLEQNINLIEIWNHIYAENYHATQRIEQRKIYSKFKTQ